MISADGALLQLTVDHDWERAFAGASRDQLEAALPALLNRHRWFGGKGRLVAGTRITEVVPIPAVPQPAVLAFIEVAYRDGLRETYVLPVTAAFGGEAERVSREHPRAVMAALAVQSQEHEKRGILYDAALSEPVMHELLTLIRNKGKQSGSAGTLEATRTAAFEGMFPGKEFGPARLLRAEQSNTSIVFEERAVLKLYRRIQAGLNPDLEIGRYLTAIDFPHTAQVGGALEYRRNGADPTTIGLLQRFIGNQGDGWSYMLREIDSYCAGLSSDVVGQKKVSPVPEHAGPDDPASKSLGRTASTIALLGQRTAELHRALALAQVPALAPEPMTKEYCESRIASMRGLWNDARQLLVQRLADLPETVRRQAEEVLEQEAAIMTTFASLPSSAGAGSRIRCHGDYHLGQVLWTGEDFVIIDFEGEPARPLAERRMKHSPLYDVAGMLRSFDYAAHAGFARRGDSAQWAACSKDWSRNAQEIFGQAYRRHTEEAAGWPAPTEAAVLLTVHQLEKAVYELRYELNNRPEWAAIPLAGLLDLLATGAGEH